MFLRAWAPPSNPRHGTTVLSRGTTTRAARVPSKPAPHRHGQVEQRFDRKGERLVETGRETIHVEPGDQVVAGRTVLAELDTAELRSQLLKARADRKAHLTRAAAALRDGRTAEAQIARADAAKVDAEVDLLARRIDQARLVAPIGGTVLTGEWADQIDAPVRKGQVLFEIAPLDRLRAELSVPEDVIADVRAGRRGELAPAAAPSRRVGFVVERVGEVAEVVDRRNVFRVRVRLDALPDGAGLKPGMKGLAKVRVGRRRYAWMWTRRLINWLRMKLWW